MRVRRSANAESGQAAVEAALTLPLMIFIILGTLQLFMMMQGRILAQYAAFRAVRVGSTNSANCDRMTHAAILTLIPAIEPFMRQGDGRSPGQKLAGVFRKYMNNRYGGGAGGSLQVSDGGNWTDYTGDIVWIARRSPDAAAVAALPLGQDTEFDQPDRPDNLARLDVRLVFWFPLRVPFANWVMSRMFLANLRLQDYTAQNPWLLTETAQWPDGNAPEGAAINLDRGLDLGNEMMGRIARKEYVFPIEANYSMRMMTPPKASNFATQHCPGVRTN
jgi:hypothetical protein